MVVFLFQVKKFIELNEPINILAYPQLNMFISLNAKGYTLKKSKSFGGRTNQQISIKFSRRQIFSDTGRY